MGFYFMYFVKKKKKSQAATRENLAADFTPDKFEEFLETVTSGQTSQRKVAAHYETCRTTLRNKVKNKFPPTPKNPTIFTGN
jgi:hypothetical protein